MKRLKRASEEANKPEVPVVEKKKDRPVESSFSLVQVKLREA